MHWWAYSSNFRKEKKEMITESIIIGGTVYFYLNWWKFKIKNKWNKIINSKSNFTNKLGKSLKIWKIQKEEYGYRLVIELPYSYTVKDLESDLDIFREGLQLESIQIESKGNIITLSCIKSIEFKEYMPIKLPANQLLIAAGLTNPITVNMNSFPHMLIGGDTGTGKSRILLLILTNLIKNCDDVEIHLLQLRKNDLGVFKNCGQVKSNCNSLEEILDSLNLIDSECKRREKLIDNTKGYYSIEDYNKSNNKLNYIYVVIEEFSFLNRSQGDTKEEKKLKSQCLKRIKTIVNVGRSSGVFLITALQKPTNDSIPSDIKAQLCTRISLRIDDGPAAKVILGNEHSTDLKERELIIRTLGEEKGYSYTIDHNKIMENIKDSIVEKKYKKEEVNKKEDINDILEALNEINK